jgi:hypothetical protein
MIVSIRFLSLNEARFKNLTQLLKNINIIEVIN